MKFRFIVPLTIGAALAWGAEFWDSKPFTQWSDKEVTKIMTDSPWAKAVATVVDLKKLREMAAAAGKGGGKGGVPGAAPMFELTVRWQSALTLREAMARSQFGAEAGTSEKVAEFLARPQRHYVFMISRLPMRYFKGINPENFRAMIGENAQLLVKGIEPLKPADVQYQATEQELTVFLAFPREQQLTAEHKEAELVAAVGPIMVKRKFKLTDMMRGGKLDL